MGVYRYSDGAVYEGGMRDGMSHGNGVYRYKDGRMYTGNFLLDKQHGQGILTSKDGNILYKGEYKNGKKMTGEIIDKS